MSPPTRTPRSQRSIRALGPWGEAPLEEAREEVRAALAKIHGDLFERLRTSKADDRISVVTQLRDALRAGGDPFLDSWLGQVRGKKSALGDILSAKQFVLQSEEPDEENVEPTETVLRGLMGVSLMVVDHAFGEFFYAGMYHPLLTPAQCGAIMNSVFVPLGQGSVGWAHKRRGESAIRTVTSTLLELRGKVGIEDLTGGNLSVQMVSLAPPRGTVHDAFGLLFFFVPVPGFFPVQRPGDAPDDHLAAACKLTADRHAVGLYGLVGKSRAVKLAERVASLVDDGFDGSTTTTDVSTAHFAVMKSIMGERTEYEPFGAVVGLALQRSGPVFLPTALVVDRRYFESRLSLALDQSSAALAEPAGVDTPADRPVDTLLGANRGLELQAGDELKIALWTSERLTPHLSASLNRLVQPLAGPLRDWLSRVLDRRRDVEAAMMQFLVATDQATREGSLVAFRGAFEKLRTMSDATDSYCGELARAIADGPLTNLPALQERLTMLFDALDAWGLSEQHEAPAIVDAVEELIRALDEAELYPAVSEMAPTRRSGLSRRPPILLAAGIQRRSNMHLRLEPAAPTGSSAARSALKRYLEDKSARRRLEQVTAMLADIDEASTAETRQTDGHAIRIGSALATATAAHRSVTELFEVVGFTEELELLARSDRDKGVWASTYQLVRTGDTELRTKLEISCGDNMGSVELRGSLDRDWQFAGICANDYSLSLTLGARVARLHGTGDGLEVNLQHPDSVGAKLAELVFNGASGLANLVKQTSPGDGIRALRSVVIGLRSETPQEAFLFGFSSEVSRDADVICRALERARESRLYAREAATKSELADTRLDIVHHLSVLFTTIQTSGWGLDVAMQACRERGALQESNEERLVAIFTRSLIDAVNKVDELRLAAKSADPGPPNAVAELISAEQVLFRVLRALFECFRVEGIFRAAWPDKSLPDTIATDALTAMLSSGEVGSLRRFDSELLSAPPDTVSEWKVWMDSMSFERLADAPAVFGAFGIDFDCAVSPDLQWPGALSELALSELILNAVKYSNDAWMKSERRSRYGIRIVASSNRLIIANTATAEHAKRLTATANSGHGRNALLSSLARAGIASVPRQAQSVTNANGYQEHWVEWVISWS